MTDNEHHVTLDAVKDVITILEPLGEEQRPIVLNMVEQLLGIKKTTSKSGDEKTDLSEMSPKEFLKEKRPETDVQRVACLAYYLTHFRQQPHFKTADISKLNTEGAYPKFANAAAAVKNATNQNKYLTQAEKGKKQITAYGEDVVHALPDQNAVKSVLGQKPVRKKRTSKKKK